MQQISPDLRIERIPTLKKVGISFVIILIGLVTCFMAFAGVFLFPLMWGFRKRNSPTNSFGWFMMNTALVFWYWDNDYDGLVSQKNGKNYSDYPLGSFRGCFHWAVIRNPANNWGRYALGFHYGDVQYITVDGNWRIARTHEGEYYSYLTKKYQFGWKITFSRASDRPMCGFGFRRL